LGVRAHRGYSSSRDVLDGRRSSPRSERLTLRFVLRRKCEVRKERTTRATRLFIRTFGSEGGRTPHLATTAPHRSLRRSLVDPIFHSSHVDMTPTQYSQFRSRIITS